MSKEGILSFHKKTERRETTLRNSAVRCSDYVKFHTSVAAGLKTGQFNPEKETL